MQNIKKNNVLISEDKVLAVLILLILISVGLFSTRSIWVDESRLLVNIHLIDFISIIQPMPYYDQASPVIPLLITKVFSFITGTNFYLLRVLTFVATTSFVIPLIIWLLRKRNVSHLCWFALIYLVSLYSTVFYSTEIKHYCFEMASVFLFLYWFLIYCEDNKTALNLRYIWIPAFTVYIGFSTIIVVPAFFTFVLMSSLINRDIDHNSIIEVIKKHLMIATLLLIVGLLTYFQMKQLTVFQIGNQWSQDTYGTKGLVNDFITLVQCFIEIYGRPFSLVAFISSICALFMSRNSLAFKLNLFLIIVVGLVFVLKLAGLYPVIYGRHILWILPISILVTTFVMPELVKSKNNALRTVFLVLVSLLLIGFTWNFYRVLKGDYKELANNTVLFYELSKQPESDVLVFRETESLVDIFKIISPISHRFYGVAKSERFSSKKSTLNEQIYSDWQYTQLPQHQSFLTIISHSDAIDAEPANDRIRALRATFKKNSCVFVSIYKGKRVQLLRVNCK